jgi:uncharacterized SAM-binding protein YcdF (DUF218 family)
MQEKQRRLWPRPGFILAGLVVVLAWVLLLNAIGASTASGSADCLLVPGARVQSDGQPGPSLRARLDAALIYYGEGRARHLICTGGRGDSGHVEAKAARDYLVARGVPAEAVVLEDMSHTTWENFVFARDEMRRRGWRSCQVVTDPFHMPRCLGMARELALRPTPAPSFGGPGWRRPGSNFYYSAREVAAWAKYLGERAGRFWFNQPP